MQAWGGRPGSGGEMGEIGASGRQKERTEMRGGGHGEGQGVLA